VGDAEHPQGGGKLLPAQMGQLIVIECRAPVRGGTSFGEADYARFRTALVGLHQRAAKSSALIVGVGSDAHQPQR
jgi:hypothetical protein